MDEKVGAMPPIFFKQGFQGNLPTFKDAMDDETKLTTVLANNYQTEEEKTNILRNNLSDGESFDATMFESGEALNDVNKL